MSKSPAIMTLMNARVVSLAGGGGGDQGAITAQDVAYAMGVRLRGERATRIEWAVAMLRYAGHQECRAEVQQWLMAVAMRLRTPVKGKYDSVGWRGCSFAQIETLAVLVLNDFSPDRRCGLCNGRCVVPNSGGIPEACPACLGRGWIKASGEAKAALLGVHESSYVRSWVPRERALRVRLDDVDGRVWDRIAVLGTAER